MTNRRTIRYQLDIIHTDGWIDGAAFSRRTDAMKAFARREAQASDKIARIVLRDTMGLVTVIAVREFCKTEEELNAEFVKLGREHASVAIDQADAYDDSRSSHEDNLRDTLWEQHRSATSYQVEICLDAYNDVWGATLPFGEPK